MPTSEKSVEGMYQELMKYVAQIDNEYLRRAVEYYFKDDAAFIKAVFKAHSAAKSVHHGFAGGLWSTRSVLSKCVNTM